MLQQRYSLIKMGKKTVNKVRKQRQEQGGPEKVSSLPNLLPSLRKSSIFSRKDFKNVGLFPFISLKDSTTENSTG